MNPRILIGSAEIANTIMNLSKGFRALGCETDSLLYNGNRNRFYPNNHYSITNEEHLADTRIFMNNFGNITSITPGKNLIRFIESYDIFIFVAGSSILPRLIDLPLIKKMGKIIIARHCGTETRDTELANIFFNDYGRQYPYYQRDLSVPKAACHSHRDILQLSRYHPALANKTHNIRTSENFADIISCGPASNTIALRPYYQTGPVVDADSFRCNIPKRRVPLILHAPSNQLYKRTDVIIRVLNELHEEGVPFKFGMLHDVPHDRVQSGLELADIVIDDLSSGGGSLAYEAMASGCAVLGGHNGIESPLPRNRPILNVNVNTLKERLKEVISDINYRVYLAELGRDYIDAGFSSPAGIAESLLRNLHRAKNNDFDLYPTIFSQRAFMPQGESFPEYLKASTLNVLLSHGVYPGTDLSRLLREGFLPEGCEEVLGKVPHWDAANLNQEGPWVVTGPNANYGSTRRLVGRDDFHLANVQETRPAILAAAP